MARGPKRTGEIAARTGLTAQAIRYYERRGLLRARRTQGGQRVFDPDAVEQVRFIRRAEALGFSLAEIRGLLALARGGLDAGDARARLAGYRRTARARRADLEALEAALAACARTLSARRLDDGDRAPATEILDAFGGDRGS